MNIFSIPSWYPARDNNIHGIFNKEQIDFMSQEFPDWQFGISTWGQGDLRKQLWASDHFRNVNKMVAHQKDIKTRTEVTKNVVEYYHPVLSWTKRIRKGNLDAIINSSDENYRRFVEDFGEVDLIWVLASYPGAFIGEHLSNKYEVPYVVHMHMGGYMLEGLLQDLGKRKEEFISSINGASKVICVSQFHLLELKEHGINAEVIYNPVNTDFFRIGEESGGDILAIGRLEKQKSFNLLIDALEQVPDKNLKIVGKGFLEQELKNQVSRLNLTNRVKFLGAFSREQIRNEIQKCSFLVLSSIHETFGLVLIEAMSCGKPVVATMCGGPEEILSNETGYLCEPSSSDLANKLNLMIKNRDAFDKIKIRALAQKKYGSQGWTKQVGQLFRSVVST